jgi:hypothetical protein
MICPFARRAPAKSAARCIELRRARVRYRYKSVPVDTLSFSIMNPSRRFSFSLTKSIMEKTVNSIATPNPFETPKKYTSATKKAIDIKILDNGILNVIRAMPF